ncbi:transporter substrate-binding domain-containing protein [Phaeobacter sp. G2]|nr:transporter substrate-binding domain-containing protein [Phaeobacter sp. G2]
MPFTNFKPFAHVGPDGRPAGFSVELAEMIAAEIGVPVEFQYVPTAPDVVATLASGRAQLFAGIVQLPALSQTYVFSDPVASETLLFTVLASNRTAFSVGPIQNLRIGVMPTVLGSEEPILADNIAVPFSSLERAVVSLLSGGVDALLIPPITVYRLARAADIDGRLSFVGDPLQEATRHVALHESLAALLGPINEALARLEADGRLPALRRAYSLDVPAQPPDVLTVGVTDFGNYTIINDDGSFSGFAVEVLQYLAELADLELKFTPITSEEWGLGPGVGPFDMLPQISVSAERASRMDFTLPIERGAFGIFMRQGETDDVLGLNDLVDRPVAIQEISRTNHDARNAGMTNIVTFDDLEPMIAALERKEVDAFLYSVDPVEAFIEQSGNDERIEMVQPAYLQV